MEKKVCVCLFIAPWNTKYQTIAKPFHYIFCLLNMENNTRSEVQQERFAQDYSGNSLLNQIMNCDSVLTQWFPSTLSLQFQEKQNLYSEAVDAVHALCSWDDHTGPQLNTICICISYLCLQHICTFFFIIAMQSRQVATSLMGEVWVRECGGAGVLYPMAES